LAPRPLTVEAGVAITVTRITENPTVPQRLKERKLPRGSCC